MLVFERKEKKKKKKIKKCKNGTKNAKIWDKNKPN